MNKNLVSVIIPTYKRPYIMIEKAIMSVLNQTYKNLELIIVDDSPKTFNERKNIEKRIEDIGDKRIKYIKHEINMGGCAARNTGIKHSNGEFIAFLDDDDEWIESKLDKQLKYLKSNNLDMVYCYWTMCTIKQNSINKRERKLTKRKGKTVFESLLYNNYIGSTSFVLIKKECFDKCGVFNENLKSCQDWDMWLRISKKFNVGYVEEPLVNYYIHNLERITTNNFNQIEGHESILRLYQDDLKDNPEALRSQIHKLALIYFDDKQYDKGLDLFKQSIRIKPFNYKEIGLLSLKLLKRRLFV